MDIKIALSKDGKSLMMEVPINQTEVKSKSGKSTVIASTNGNKAVAIPNFLGGKQFFIGINAYVK